MADLDAVLKLLQKLDAKQEALAAKASDPSVTH
jgi:hypothetical protein